MLVIDLVVSESNTWWWLNRLVSKPCRPWMLTRYWIAFLRVLMACVNRRWLPVATRFSILSLTEIHTATVTISTPFISFCTFPSWLARIIENEGFLAFLYYIGNQPKPPQVKLMNEENDRVYRILHTFLYNIKPVFIQYCSNSYRILQECLYNIAAICPQLPPHTSLTKAHFVCWLSGHFYFVWRYRGQCV